MTDELAQDNNEKSVNAELLDDIERLNPEQKTEIMATLEMYSGPLPHPEILKQYQELYSGAAKEIIKNGVAESKHRRRLENARSFVKLFLSFLSLIIFAGLAYLFIKW